MSAETKHVRLAWQRAMVFTGEGSGKVPLTIDADNAAGTGPMETLLLALAACTGADVCSILVKKRVALEALVIDVAGDRREQHPRKFTAIRLTFRIRAPGLAEDAARQAIALSLEKYCSVRHTLDPSIAVGYDVVIEA